jgi:hypothetical protein
MGSVGSSRPPLSRLHAGSLRHLYEDAEDGLLRFDWHFGHRAAEAPSDRGSVAAENPSSEIVIA